MRISSEVRRRCQDAVDRAGDRLLALSRSLHAEPETAFREHRSAAKVSDLLRAEGFDVETGVGGLDTAFTARYGNGPLVVGLCAEYDALPGLGHACGHNIIAASSVGAALALREVAGELDITVVVIGTPAEEEGGGKITLLEAGVFDAVSMAMLVHPAPEDNCAPRPLALLELEVRYTGRESHSALAPHLGVNAADALTVAEVAVGVGRQHFEPRQQVHGIVTRGGTVPNVVPADTRALYNLRAADMESLRRLETRIRACFAAGAVATGCTHEVVATPAYAELAHDPFLSEAYRLAATALGRPLVSRERERDMPTGSTDMGNVSRALPSLQPSIGIDSGDAVNHQPEFAAACVTPGADRALLQGAVALAWTAAQAAEDDQTRQRLLDRHRERRVPSTSPA
ncbi:M20 family metallopeptidase [Micromonospora sp. WMMA1363]|uniref:M20 family metallopeptidase n=1 Tax=Micromonospora sp. WMMA1363 TaxID=3053985 RepID=UPI00259CD9C7|nr:M20 family metallopeptidase [Micromonospora sp. WMMA1363]MDM4719457.1 M20 family metallopeptidase [Micromonospora sp. WMMA1363]